MMTPTLSLLLLVVVVVTAQAQETPEQRNFITDKLCLLGLGKVGETVMSYGMSQKIKSPILLVGYSTIHIISCSSARLRRCQILHTTIPFKIMI